MSIRHNGNIIAGASQYHPDLFDFKWADHELNDIQWLRGDTFSWQDGSVYQAAYNHLVDDIEASSYIYLASNNYYRSKTDDVSGASYPYAWKRNNNQIVYSNTLTPDPQTDMLNSSPDGTGASMYFDAFGYTTQTETVGGTTIQYILADDGHKIVLADQESNVASIYSATGVAWYYILDTTNQRFKLPRTKFGFTGLRDTVGKYVEAGLPSFSATFNVCDTNGGVTASGDITLTNYQNGAYGGGNGRTNSEATATLKPSNSIYGNSTTVQPPATQMYLYFYVGSFTQTAIENTAGITAETLNDKVDKGHQVIEFQEPTSANNYIWYRKYADGWVEQGGIVLQSSSAKQTVSLPIEMSDSTYSILANPMDDSLSNYVFCVKATDKTTTSFKSQVWGSYNQGIATSGYNFVWQVNGIAA